MLKITVQPRKYWDSKREMFFTYPEKPVTLQLEHSLVSLSKWEAKWNKPFLSSTDKRTAEEIQDYVRCMLINKDVDPNIFLLLPEENIKEIIDYIDAPMTATTFSNRQDKPGKEIITNELIYYWMIVLQIPFNPCEKWHLNRLMTLIRVCSIKNAPQKTMGANEIRNRNRALNDARRKAMHTRG